MLNVKMRACDVGDYIGWIKVLVTICSAAVATLLYKYDATSSTHFAKWAALLFCIALVLFTMTFAGLIEHKVNTTGDLEGRTKWSLLAGYAFFLAGFAVLVVRMF